MLDLRHWNIDSTYFSQLARGLGAFYTSLIFAKLIFDSATSCCKTYSARPSRQQLTASSQKS